MRSYDLYWLSNTEWWEVKDGIPVIKKDAPEYAQKSYRNYLEQKKRK